jgi:hypothetical protein
LLRRRLLSLLLLQMMLLERMLSLLRGRSLVRPFVKNAASLRFNFSNVVDGKSASKFFVVQFNGDASRHFLVHSLLFSAL